MFERTTDNNVSAGNVSSSYSYVQENSRIDVKSNSFLCKVYGYMFVALLITFVTAYAIGIPFMMLMNQAVATNDAALAETLFVGYLVGIIVASVGIVVCSFVIAFMRKRSIAIPGIIYAFLMGVLLADIVGIVNQEGSWIIPAVFAITAMMFGIMYFVAKLGKNLSWAGSIAIGLAAGVVLLSLSSFALFFFISDVQLFLIYVVIEVLTFFLMFFVTIYDIWRIQKIAENGFYNKNLALYCALNLYSDFIYIFLRILRVVLVIVGKSKK